MSPPAPDEARDFLRVRSLGRITHEYATLDFICIKHRRISDVARILQGALKFYDELGL